MGNLPTDRKVEKDQPHLTTQLDVDLLENDWTKHNTNKPITSKMMIPRIQKTNITYSNQI